MRVLLLSIFYYGSVLYSIVNPVYGLLFFVHIMLFRPENLTWGTPLFGQLHLFTAVATCIGYLVRRHDYLAKIQWSGFQNTNMLIFSLFVGWLVVASLGAEHSPEASFVKTLDIAKIAVFCFLFSRIIREAKHLMQYVWVCAISLGLLSLWGVLQGLAGNYRLEELWGIGGSNILGALLVLMAPFIFANVFDVSIPTPHRFVLLVCAVVTILCAIYTDSRGAFLGLAVGMLMLLVQLKQRIKVLGVLFIALLFASPWFPESYSSRIETIFSPAENLDSSAAARPVLWKIAFRIWLEHPIAGVGLDNFSEEKERYATRLADTSITQEIGELIFNQPRVPHSLYFTLLSEVGVVGLALYLFLFARNALFRPPRQLNGFSVSPLYYQTKGAQAGLVGFGCAALFGDFYYIEPLYLQMFWVGAAHDVVSSSQVEPSSVGNQIGAAAGMAAVTTGKGR